MRLALPRCEKMPDGPPVDGEVIRDQSSVASPPERLSAHERGARFAREAGKAFVAARDLRAAHVVGVAAERGDPQRVVRRIRAGLATAAELRKMNIGDADFAKCCFERHGSEVRVPPGSGEEPYVRESSDVGV